MQMCGCFYHSVTQFRPRSTHFKQLTFTKSNDSEKEESKEKILDYMEKPKEESHNGNKLSTEAGEPSAKKGST